MTKTAERRIEFANGTLGCLTAFLLVFALVVFLLAGFADLSESNVRGAQLFTWIQRIKIGDFPLGAAVLAGYFLFESSKNGWRWADRTALLIDGDRVTVHRSYLRSSIALTDVISVSPTRRTSAWVKSINPALIISWRDAITMRDRQITIRNLELGSPDAQVAIQLFNSLGRWVDADKRTTR